MLDASQDRRAADLVAIEVQDRQHGSVADWVEQLVGLPRGCQWTCLRLTVAYDAGHDQAGIVERGAEGMTQRVAQFATFMNRSGGRRRNLAGNSSGKRELLEELF